MKKMSFSEIKPFVRYARYMEIEENTVLPHAIPCDSRLFYTLNGTGKVEVNGTSYQMTRGDTLIFGAGTEYRICPAENNVTYVILNFDYTFGHSHLSNPIPPKAPETFCNSDVIEQVCFEDVDELSLPVFFKKKLDFSDKMIEIERDFSRKILYFETKISNILSEILIDCVRELKLQTVPDGYERIDAILKYIHDNYSDKMSNISLGEKFGFHPNYISHLIKKYTGMPLHRYILHVKVSHAIEMLDGGQLSVGEIADRCGFCDIYYFSRLFKQYMGISPL